jgi:HD-GYP domain-containing protein (c-di-GMP phosphodiesterase class II)
MAKKEKILIENEKDANFVVARVMRITFIFFTVLFLLNVIGVFVVNKTVMTIAYIFGSLLLFLPTILLKICKEKYVFIKIVNVCVAVILMSLLSATLNYHVIVFFVFPIVISSLYFSKRLNIFATVLTVIGVSCGELFSYFFETVRDKNWSDVYGLVVFGIVPRDILIIAMGSIFTMLSERTTSLLRKLLTAEKNLKKNHKEMIIGFATLVENKDGSTGGHIKRTSIYVKLLANELRKRGYYTDILTDEYLENLYQAAPMHDIGKIAVPDVILQKPGKLTAEEFDVIKQHTVNGGKIIKETFVRMNNHSYSRVAYEVAKYHHEKWNGNGYPKGLKEDKIPLCARIMAIADVFDAVSEKRCYRDALPLEQCFSIIEEGKGSDFEPILVDVFLDMKEKIVEGYNLL